MVPSASPRGTGTGRSPRSGSRANGREIFASADDLGQRPLFAIDVGSLERRKLSGPGNVPEFETAGERIVFALQSLTAPVDLYLIEGHAPARPLTRVNAARLADVRFGEAEQIHLRRRGR